MAWSGLRLELDSFVSMPCLTRWLWPTNMETIPVRVRTRDLQSVSRTCNQCVTTDSAHQVRCFIVAPLSLIKTLHLASRQFADCQWCQTLRTCPSYSKVPLRNGDFANARGIILPSSCHEGQAIKIKSPPFSSRLIWTEIIIPHISSRLSSSHHLTIFSQKSRQVHWRIHLYMCFSNWQSIIQSPKKVQVHFPEKPIQKSAGSRLR